MAAGVFGCGGDSPPAIGAERGACFPNSTCNTGLTCLSNFCVKVDVDAAAGGPVVDAAVDAGGKDARASEVVPEVAFQPAAHPRLPQVANRGGPVLDSPKVRPIFFAGDPDIGEIESFLGELTRTGYWSETTSEYGVGPLVLQPTEIIMRLAPPTMPSTVLSSLLTDSTSGLKPAWGAPDPSTIYMFVLPQGSIVTFSNGATCCSDFGGYHSEALSSGPDNLPYAVICSCPAAFGLNLTPLQARTTTISHELVEAATDPFPSSNPAYWGTDQANIIWTLVTGGELADMCGFHPDQNFVPPGSKYMVQRSWSNAAARRSHNPCVPQRTAAPYFNSYPTLNAITFGAKPDDFTTQGIRVPIGQSKTIDIALSSNAPTDRRWSVGMYTYEDLRGGDPSSLGLLLDKNTGWNGDILKLTISPKKLNPELGGQAFIIMSRYGEIGDADFQTNVTMGLVKN